jgi:DNA-binding MarR family transcriptional regulator
MREYKMDDRKEVFYAMGFYHFPVSKPFVKILKDQRAIMLSFLIHKIKKEDVFFEIPQEEIEKELGYTQEEIQNIINSLKDLNILIHKERGLKNYFSMNGEVIADIIEKGLC